MLSTTMLNGGSIKDYTPIGEDGRPVWQHAEAFRLAIARSRALGQSYAEMLAVPRFTDSGDQVNWFVPFAPNSSKGHQAVMWSAATTEEKNVAWKQLREFERRLELFGQDLELHALSADDRLFAHFLTGTSATEHLPAIHFPNEDCVYIVDGKPVITFWGFLNSKADLLSSPFASLKPAPSVSTASQNVEETVHTTVLLPWWKRHLWCWLLPLMLLLALLLTYLWWWWLWARPVGGELFKTLPDLTHASLEPIDTRTWLSREGVSLSHDEMVTTLPAYGGKSVATDEPKKEDPNITEDEVLKAQDATTSPVQEEIDTPKRDVDSIKQDDESSAEVAKEGEGHSGEDQANNQQESSLQDPASPESDFTKTGEYTGNTDENGNLKLDPKVLSSSDVSGLDGSWNTSAGLVDSKTGQPVSIRYHFKNGQGQAEVARADGTKCSVATKGNAANTTLTISGGLARCSDGGAVRLPEVKCVSGKDGKTSCAGEYSEQGGKKEQVQMDLFR